MKGLELESTASGTPAIMPARLKQRTISSSIWTIGAFGFQQVFRLGSNVVLSHLLFPEAFGLMALANVFLYALNMMSDFGVRAVIVQSYSGDERAFLDTAWTVQAIRGVVLFTIAVLLAQPYGGFYGNTLLAPIVTAISVVLLLDGFQSTKLALLERQVDLSRIMLMNVSCQVIGIAVMIGWAVTSPTTWALAAGVVVERLVKLVLSHLIRRGPRDRLQWNGEYARQILSFGRWILVSSFITALAARLDLLLLGKLLPIEVLGVYNIALMLASMPSVIGAQVASAVIYPALSELARKSPERMNEVLLSARSVMLYATGFLVIGVTALGPTFFQILYDTRYQGAGRMCQLLMITIWFSLMGLSADRVLPAMGDPRSLSILNGWRMFANGGGALTGYSVAGVEGFIIGLGVGGMLGQFVLWTRLQRHGIEIVGQDVRYSLALGIAALIAVLGRTPFGHLVGLDPASVVCSLVWASVVLLPTGAHAAIRAYGAILR